MQDKLADFLASFRGWTCSDFSAGVIGSVFYLYFQSPDHRGNRFERPHSPGPGEMILNVWCAAWRVEDLDSRKVLATCDDDNSPDGPLLAGLQQLVGRTVRDIELEVPGLDCQISFDKSLRLMIFPIGVDTVCPADYSLCTSDKVLEVGPRSTWHFASGRNQTPSEGTPAS